MPDHLIVYWMNIHIPMWVLANCFGCDLDLEGTWNIYREATKINMGLNVQYTDVHMQRYDISNVYTITYVYIYIYIIHIHMYSTYIIFIHIYIYRHTVCVHRMNQRMSSNNGWKSMSTHIHMNSTPDWNLKVDSSLRHGISFCAVLVDPVSTRQTTIGTCFLHHLTSLISM